MIAAIGLVVIAIVATQPVGKVYEIVAMPADTPLTKPVDEPTVATDISLLLHTPPGVVLLNVNTPPEQRLPVPVIGDNALIVIALVAVQAPIE